ncbi:hypothetical protein KUV85_16680 [Nocardioides panacisoli]|uniref:hypothetical protein n=1 Tax=Nocardioides panacisoli TaxID=627624 RepID=UPI001C62A97B|nr:hypothetical protein [Nocardioides panacisoli]QYJ03935.1 hypothetical protein KUV85_16680 [Nocardioides panacisoli]
MSTTGPAERLRFHELRRILRLRRAQLTFTLAAVRLLWCARQGQVKEIWVGDSHAALVPATTVGAPLRHVGDGHWSCHLGPRLMFSIARDGLPSSLVRISRLIARTRNAGAIRWIYTFGEIDTRCHLAPRLERPGAFDFVATYLDRIHDGARQTGADRVLVLVPFPASDRYPDQTGFPKVGTPAERIRACAIVREELHRAASTLPAGRPRVLLLDRTEDLVDDTGAASEWATSDGVHTNDNGRAVLREEINRLLATSGS